MIDQLVIKRHDGYFFDCLLNEIVHEGHSDKNIHSNNKYDDDMSQIG